MNRRLLFAGLWLSCTGCSADVAVQTQPFSQALPVTSVGLPVYAEVAVDIPPAAVGPDITVQEIFGDGTLVNKARSTLSVSARLSLTGQATPGTPYLFTEANKPPYFASALVLLPATQLSGSASRPVHVTNPQLTSILGQQRIWLILSNTATQLALGDTPPLEADLNDFILQARVTKSFAGLSPAQELSGL